MIFASIIHDGYQATRLGHPLADCPWPAPTVGAHAWTFGHALGSLPAPVRWSLVGGAWAPGGGRAAAHLVADFARGVTGW